MKGRKALKNLYKEMKFRIGVFQVRNIANGKIFIDSSTNLEAIWNRIRFQLNAGNFPNATLQSDWRMLDKENFAYEIISEIKQDDASSSDYGKEARQLKEMFMEELCPFGERGYYVRK